MASETYGDGAFRTSAGAGILHLPSALDVDTFSLTIPTSAGDKVLGYEYFHGHRYSFGANKPISYPILDPWAGTLRSYSADQDDTLGLVTSDSFRGASGDMTVAWTAVDDLDDALSTDPGTGVYTPDLFGGVADDPNTNNRNALAWAMNFAERYPGVGTVDLQGKTWWFRGAWEIKNNTRLRNGTLKLQANPMYHNSLTWQAFAAAKTWDDPDGPTFEEYLTGIDECRSAIMLASDCAFAQIRDITYDGSIDVAGNMDFVGDPDYDNTADSADLRESPTWCGLYSGDHGNRQVAPGRRIVMSDVRIANFGGSCFLGRTDGRGHTRLSNCTFGNSVSGRILYGGGNIEFDNLTLFGQSRTSVHRTGGSFVGHGYRYRYDDPLGGTPTTYWASNQGRSNTLGMAVHTAATSDFRCRITGLDVDLTGSGFFQLCTLCGNDTLIRGRFRKDDEETQRTIVVQAKGGSGSIASENCVVDLDVVCGDTRGANVMQLTGVNLTWFVNLQASIRYTDNGVSLTRDLSDPPTYSPTNYAISLQCNPGMDHTINLIDCRFPPSRAGLQIHAIDADFANMAPVALTATRCKFDNDRNNFIVESGGGVDTVSDNLPLTISLVACERNEGTDTWLGSAAEIAASEQYITES